MRMYLIIKRIISSQPFILIKKLPELHFWIYPQASSLHRKVLLEYIDQMLNNFQPKEVLFEKGKKDIFIEDFGPKFYTFKLDDWIFTQRSCN